MIRVVQRLAVCIAISMALANPALSQDRRYDEPYDGVEQDEAPPRETIRDGYPEPVPPPRSGYEGVPARGSYKDDEPPPVRRSAHCLTKPGLRAALNDQGWYHFDNVDYRGRVAFMTAENVRGRRFEVEFDACSGDVVNSRPVEVYVERPAPPVYYGYGYYGAPRPYVGIHVYRDRPYPRGWR